MVQLHRAGLQLHESGLAVEESRREREYRDACGGYVFGALRQNIGAARLVDERQPRRARGLHSHVLQLYELRPAALWQETDLIQEECLHRQRPSDGCAAVGGGDGEGGDEAEDAEGVDGVDAAAAIGVAGGVQAPGGGGEASDDAQDLEGVDGVDGAGAVDIALQVSLRGPCLRGWRLRPAVLRDQEDSGQQSDDGQEPVISRH